jgi:hypothetical protein
LNNRSKTKTQEITAELIGSFKETNKTDDFLNLCNGHDVTALFALLIIRIIGKKTTQDVFCGYLRTSFQLPHFIKTQLYQDIVTWQDKNSFKII